MVITRDLEIILVNAGSIDKGSSLCDSYFASDRRITVFHQRNSGVSAAKFSTLNLAGNKPFMLIAIYNFVDRTIIVS